VSTSIQEVAIQSEWKEKFFHIYDLSLKALRSKEDLLNLILYFHDELEDEYHEAKFLVATLNDVRKWMEIWSDVSARDGVVDYSVAFETNRLFRHWKIDQQSTDFDEFQELLFLDVHDWVETYFQQSYYYRIAYEVDKLLDSLSAQEIWDIRKKYPYARVEYLLSFSNNL
jgi:hypothetical protein